MDNGPFRNNNLVGNLSPPICSFCLAFLWIWSGCCESGSVRVSPSSRSYCGCEKMSRCQDTTGCQCSEAASPGRAGENWIYPGLLEQEGNAVFLSLLLTHTYQKHQNSGTDPWAWESCCCLQYCLTMGSVTVLLYLLCWVKSWGRISSFTCHQ